MNPDYPGAACPRGPGCTPHALFSDDWRLGLCLEAEHTEPQGLAFPLLLTVQPCCPRLWGPQSWALEWAWSLVQTLVPFILCAGDPQQGALSMRHLDGWGWGCAQMSGTLLPRADITASTQVLHPHLIRCWRRAMATAQSQRPLCPD